MVVFLRKNSSTNAMLIASCFVLGFISKEMVITLPLILLLLSVIQRKFAERLRLCLLLMLVGLGIFLVRGAIIDSFLAGGRTASYFTLSSAVVVSIAKYVFSIFVPFAPHIIYDFPILLLVPAAFIGWVAYCYVLSHSGKEAHLKLLLTIACLVLALSPVILKYAPWYLYFVSVFVILVLARLANPTYHRASIKTALALQVMLCLALSSVPRIISRGVDVGSTSIAEARCDVSH